MSERTVKKSVLSQYNKYLQYRKEVERSGASFTEEISRVASSKDIAVVHKHAHAHTGRKFAPPRLSKPANITINQANRLARFAPLIQEAAAKHNVPVELICGVILQESGGDPRAKSHAGAKGLMQLMPATARRFGVKDAYDPKQNIDGGTKYLSWLLERFNGNIELVLAAYNAGEGNIEKHGNKIPPFKETQQYVPAVLSYTQAMIDILLAARTEETLPSHARRV
jgi:soluble lytic murein transglycosylase-like protein